MTASTLGTRTFPRPARADLTDRVRTRLATSLAERRADRACRAQTRAFAALDGASQAEVLAAARRA